MMIHTLHVSTVQYYHMPRRIIPHCTVLYCSVPYRPWEMMKFCFHHFDAEEPGLVDPVSTRLAAGSSGTLNPFPLDDPPT